MAANSGKQFNSGIRKLSNGESVIPSSTRADGSVRKEIKVKPGYRPPEDVEVYKNRTAAAWKNRGSGGVPGAEKLAESPSLAQSAAAAKNAKRREARKKAATDGKDGETASAAVANGTTTTTNGDEQPAEQVDPEVEAAKEARKLSKKLRQARELKDKKENGEGLLPEQFAKVIKIQELIRQLDLLGL